MTTLVEPQQLPQILLSHAQENLEESPSYYPCASFSSHPDVWNSWYGMLILFIPFNEIAVDLVLSCMRALWRAYFFLFCFFEIETFSSNSLKRRSTAFPLFRFPLLPSAFTFSLAAEPWPPLISDALLSAGASGVCFLVFYKNSIEHEEWKMWRN